MRLTLDLSPGPVPEPHSTPTHVRGSIALLACLALAFATACSGSEDTDDDTSATEGDTQEGDVLPLIDVPATTDLPTTDTSETQDVQPADQAQLADLVSDTGRPDRGRPDGGRPDGGRPDGGRADRGGSEGAICANNTECTRGEFCDFAGDFCDVWGGTGVCTRLPEECGAGGPGACGCGGEVRTNPCEINAMGTDVMGPGGCELAEGTYRCGELDCDPATSYCNISMNDIAGPDQPDYYASCVALPEACLALAVPTCDCLEVDPWWVCTDQTGYIMSFYPGG